MKPIRVMIVEDDFMVAKINRKLTEAVPGFEVTKVFLKGEECLEHLKQASVDLMILDVYLPDISGIEVLKRIRASDYRLDVILMTAAHDHATVEDSIRLGVFDYLIKPVEFERYRESLLNYRRMKGAFDANTDFDQKRLDTLITFRTLLEHDQKTQKGIALETLRMVEDALISLPVHFTIDDVMRQLALSRVTTRRYLEYLVKHRCLTKFFQYKKIGRPTMVYAKRNDEQKELKEQ